MDEVEKTLKRIAGKRLHVLLENITKLEKQIETFESTQRGKNWPNCGPNSLLSVKRWIDSIYTSPASITNINVPPALRRASAPS